MIQLTITDSQGNELQLGDVICIHYPNPNIKFFGILKFDEKENVFRVDDYDGWEPFNKNLSWCTYERLASKEVLHRELVKELGKVEVEDVKQFDKIFSLCQY